MAEEQNDEYMNQLELIEELTERDLLNEKNVRIYCPDGNGDDIYKLTTEKPFTVNPSSYSVITRVSDPDVAREMRNSFFS